MGRQPRTKQRRRGRRPGRCLGCGDWLRLTREHIVADWVRRALEVDTTGEGPGRWLQVTGDATRSRTEDYARFEIAGHVLCHGCNTGWSARLERDAGLAASPLLYTGGIARKLTGPQQQTLAAWFAKMAILGEYSDSHASEELARELLAPVASSRLPPADAQVWVGSLVRHPYFRHGWWRATFSAEVVQALSVADLLGVISLQPPRSGAELFRANPDALLRAWPTPQDAYWPPLRPVSLDEINRAFAVNPYID